MKISGIDMTAFLPSVAAQLAHMGHDEQGEFFNAFSKELVSVCGTRLQAEAQAAWVKSVASDAFKDFCAMVAHDHD